MKHCRICLKHKKSLCSVFESDQNISYASMITALCTIKIVEDSCKNNICLQCCGELRRSYDFVKQIERYIGRSEKELNEHLRVLYFNNIEDLKEKLSQESVYNEKQTYPTGDKIIHNYISHLKNGWDNIQYSNTTIRVRTSVTSNVERSKLTPITNDHTSFKDEFCESIDSHNVDHIVYDDLVECENESLEGEKKTKKIRTKYMKSKGESKKTKNYLSKRKRIKPIILEDVRVIRTKYPTTRKLRENKNKNGRRMKMCQHCGIMSSNVRSHMMVHIGERKYKCSDCKKAFYTSKQLNNHQRNHLESSNFQCNHCVAVFNNKTALQRHMMIHVDIKKHVCPVCNKGFKMKHTLQRHTLIHNSAAKTIKCELCNMSFVYMQGLRHHMRVHTGERPFKCEICSQPYSYKFDFNRHCLKKHGVCLKRRSVHVMTEEVLKQERALMKDLMLRIQGVVKEGETINPFQGPQAALAFEQAVKALGTSEIKAMM